MHTKLAVNHFNLILASTPTYMSP